MLKPMKMSKLLFMTTLMMSIIMMISSTNWINMWIALEINLMSFIPLCYKSNNNFLSQGIMMYFLTQSMASMLFIMAIINPMLNMYMNNMYTYIIMLSMMMKLGIPPFHTWFIEIMNKLSWDLCYIMMTVQKIPPLFIMSNINYTNLLYFSMISSALVGNILCLNQTSLRKLFAYSSITNLSWMLACMKMFKKSWLIYMMLYMLMMYFMCNFMNKMNMMYINQMNTQSINSKDKMSIMLMMLSLGGMPPMIGFLPKWIAINYMIKSSEMMTLLIMMIMSTISMFFYIRMSSSISMLTMNSQKWLMKPYNNFQMNIWFINMLTPLIIIILIFY